MKHLDIIVKGKVQGVYYRAHTKSVADKLGIKGEVWNREDGSVGISAEGPEAALEEFLNWCRQGPDRANVTGLESEEGALQKYSDFSIVRRK